MEDKREPTQGEIDASPEKSLGMTLRALREGAGVSQEHIAALMKGFGHSWQQTTAAKTEAGQRPIRVNEVVDLARIFDVSPGDLIDTASRMSSAHLRYFAALARANRWRSRLDAARHEVEERAAFLADAEKELTEARQESERELADTDGEH